MKGDGYIRSTHQNQQQPAVPPLPENYVKQVNALVKVCEAISNDAYSIRYEPRFQNFDPTTKRSSGPLQSIMLKITPEDQEIFMKDYGAGLDGFVLQLKELLGEGVFDRLVSQKRAARDESYFLQLNLNELLQLDVQEALSSLKIQNASLDISQTLLAMPSTRIANEANHNSKSFEALKKTISREEESCIMM